MMLMLHFGKYAKCILPGNQLPQFREAKYSDLFSWNMKQVKIKKKTSGPVVMQALIVFFSSAVVAIIGSFVYGILINIALIALIAIMILIYLIWNKALFLKLFSWLNTHKRLKKHVTTLKATHQGVRNNLLHRGSDKKPGATFLFSLAIGIFSNLVGGLMIYTITKAYNLPISYLQSVYIYAMSIIIAALSGIVPGGVGLAEGGITGLLLLLKIAISNAVLIVLIFRFINLVFYIIIGFVFLMLFYSKSLYFC